MASEISAGGNQPWSDDPHAGVGIGLAYAPTPQWDVELTVATQRHRSPLTLFLHVPDPNGTTGQLFPVTEFHEYRVMPVDLSMTRHFLTGQRLSPYVRAGVRYVEAPDSPGDGRTLVFPTIPSAGGAATPVTFTQGYGFGDRLSAQAGAGFRLHMTPRTDLRVEATRLIRSDKVDFDPLLRYAAGVSWKF